MAHGTVTWIGCSASSRTEGCTASAPGRYGLNRVRIGIDFGTSYSAAGAVVGGQLQLVRFGDEQQFRTTAYFPQTLPDAAQFLKES